MPSNNGPEICEHHAGEWGDSVLCEYCTYPDGTPKDSPGEIREAALAEGAFVALADVAKAYAEVHRARIKERQRLQAERDALPWWHFSERYRLGKRIEELSQ